MTRIRYLRGRCIGHLQMAVASCSILLVGGCAFQPRTNYTQTQASVAKPPGFDNVRIWLDSDEQPPPDFTPKVDRDNAATYLALSGGGGNGAYGAGILNGWTHSGTRPKFTAVSGVSTGALIAPLAFLGSSYDGMLQDVYTGGGAESLIQAPDLVQAVFGSGLFGNSRLLTLISKYVDADLIAAIAREHRAGRRLYVLTTNLDSQRGVVWSIGAIAASGRPDSLDLIRKVLAASASVPLAFAPVLIDAQAEGKTFQEMHADGNVTSAIFTLPLKYMATQKRTGLSGGKIFIIMNTIISPRFSVVEDSTLKVVAASLGTITTQKTLSDLAATYSYTKSTHVDFNLTSINPTLDVSGVDSFDTAYMRKLYAVGYQTGATGSFWRKSPAPTLNGRANTISASR